MRAAFTVPNLRCLEARLFAERTARAGLGLIITRSRAKRAADGFTVTLEFMGGA